MSNQSAEVATLIDEGLPFRRVRSTMSPTPSTPPPARSSCGRFSPNELDESLPRVCSSACGMPIQASREDAVLIVRKALGTDLGGSLCLCRGRRQPRRAEVRRTGSSSSPMAWCQILEGLDGERDLHRRRPAARPPRNAGDTGRRCGYPRAHRKRPSSSLRHEAPIDLSRQALDPELRSIPAERGRLIHGWISVVSLSIGPSSRW